MKQLTVALTDRQMAAIEAECLPHGMPPEEFARSVMFAALYQDEDNLEAISDNIKIERDWGYHPDWLNYLETGNGTRRPLLKPEEVSAEARHIAAELRRRESPAIPPALARLLDTAPSSEQSDDSTPAPAANVPTSAASSSPLEPISCTIPGKLAAVIRFQAALDATTPEQIIQEALISDAESFSEQPGCGYGDRYKFAKWLKEEDSEEAEGKEASL